MGAFTIYRNYFRVVIDVRHAAFGLTLIVISKDR